ncbi:MAG: hypothetical protein KJ042_07755 [Deltaproteobacteria bacterium]|nr:hypothetical protein [Deltaproteobacteria bacterium]
MKRISVLALAAALAATIAAAQFPADIAARYETKMTAKVTRVIPLETYSYIVLVDKGAAHGVKPKTMALKYGLKTADGEFAVIENFKALKPSDLTPERMRRPFAAFLSTEDDFTAFYFWTFDAGIEAMKALNETKGKAFAYPAPKVGDLVEFVVAKP